MARMCNICNEWRNTDNTNAIIICVECADKIRISKDTALIIEKTFCAAIINITTPDIIE